MRRLIAALLLLLSVFLLCSCAKEEKISVEDMANPVRFYYCPAETGDKQPQAYEQDTGALRWEIRDLGKDLPSVDQILAAYLKGPQTEELRSPFPSGLVVESTDVKNGVLTIRFNDIIGKLRGIHMTRAAACLVHTMTQFDNIESVRLEALQPLLSGLLAVPLEADDFVLTDDYMTSNQTEVKLYFPNQSGRYLREETRRGTLAGEDELPAFVLRQLIEGPKSTTALPAFPSGTQILDLQVTDGLCVLNLSFSFLENAPQSNLQARLQLLSVVNSLTALDEIEFVRFLCQGEAVTAYGPLTLPTYLVHDELAFEADEPSFVQEATVYLPNGPEGKLAAVPVFVTKSAGRMLETDLLNTLFSFVSRNGYTNPVPEDTFVLEIEVEYYTCRLTLSGAFAEYDGNPAEMERAVRSVVATLCALDTVDYVELYVADRELTSVDISSVLKPLDEWFLP